MAKKDDNCCGKTVTETTSTTTKYGMAACEPERGTLQYIGARYVPIFADPVEWDRTRTYEHLMMVQNQGNTYISKQAVPVGIDLPTSTGENDYWLLFSNWSAQIAEFQSEMREVSATTAYINTLTSGLYVNAREFGIGGVTDIQLIDDAIAKAVNEGLALVFPDDFECSSQITIPSGLNVFVLKKLTYTGTASAIQFVNAADQFAYVNRVEANGGNAISFISTPGETARRSTLEFGVLHGKRGLNIVANDWGIYECRFIGDSIFSTEIGLNVEALQLSTEHSAFVGQCFFEISRISARQGIAANIEAITYVNDKHSVITGLLFEPLSIEESVNGIYVHGDCNQVKFPNVRVLEANGTCTDYIIKTDGAVKNMVFTGQTPIWYTLIDCETTIAALKTIVINRISSPSDYEFASSLYVSSRGIGFVPIANTARTRLNYNFTFGIPETSSSWRIYTYLKNDGGSTLTYDLGYLTPFGVDEVIVSQSNSSRVIVKNGDVTIFDGTGITMTDTREEFLIKAYWDDNANSVWYKVYKLQVTQ